MWWTTGAYLSIDFIWETLSHSLARGETFCRIKEADFVPPMIDEYGEKGWVQMVEFGHSAYFEFLVQWDPYQPEVEDRFMELWIAGQRAAIDEGEYTTMMAPLSIIKLTGPNYGPNYHLWMEKIRKMLDPDNLSNPPFDIFDRLIEEQAPQLKEKYHF
jgi:hypothetical protein